MKNIVEQRTENDDFSLEALQKLEGEYGSSFYVLDVHKLRANYHKLKQAFSRRYEKVIIGYSYKTNYLPYLCQQLSSLGAYAEVVSRLEYDLAIKIGQQPQRIIFNGPLKTRDDLRYALEKQSIINLDALYELPIVQEYCLNNPNTQVKIGLRINFDISENGGSPLVGQQQLSRFGLCLENGELQEALERLKLIPNLSIVGLHAHYSTSRRSVATYRKITEQLAYLAKKHILSSLEYIDIGGGMYGEVPDSLIPDTPSFDEYAEAICGVILEQFSNCRRKPALILEPGISLVANAFTFVTKVIGIKKIRQQHFILVDGSVHNVKPTLHPKNLPMRIVRAKSPVQDLGEPESFHIVGYTCLEKDYLARDFKQVIPEIDDYFIFENVGAYTIVFNPPFIKERPAVVAKDNDQVLVVRKKETIKQFFSEDLYTF